MRSLANSFAAMRTMTAQAESREDKVLNWISKTMPYIIICYMLYMTVGRYFVFADVDGGGGDGDGGAGQAFEGIYKAVKVITTAVGAIFLIVGVVKFVIAHANEDGPSQQKAAMMIATGIALVLIGPAMSSLGFDSLVQGIDGE